MSEICRCVHSEEEHLFAGKGPCTAASISDDCIGCICQQFVRRDEPAGVTAQCVAGLDRPVAVPAGSSERTTKRRCRHCDREAIESEARCTVHALLDRVDEARDLLVGAKGILQRLHDETREDEFAQAREDLRQVREALQDMLDRFAPSDDGLSEAEIAVAGRARALLPEASR